MNDRRRFDGAHLEGLLPAVPFTRRSCLVNSLAAGFALSVQPVLAQKAIRTSTAGLATGEAKIPVADGAMPAYFAQPCRSARSTSPTG